mgnify:CR=1 FL=1
MSISVSGYLLFTTGSMILSFTGNSNLWVPGSEQHIVQFAELGLRENQRSRTHHESAQGAHNAFLGKSHISQCPFKKVSMFSGPGRELPENRHAIPSRRQICL